MLTYHFFGLRVDSDLSLNNSDCKPWPWVFNQCLDISDFTFRVLMSWLCSQPKHNRICNWPLATIFMVKFVLCSRQSRDVIYFNEYQASFKSFHLWIQRRQTLKMKADGLEKYLINYLTFKNRIKIKLNISYYKNAFTFYNWY